MKRTYTPCLILTKIPPCTLIRDTRVWKMTFFNNWKFSHFDISSVILLSTLPCSDSVARQSKTIIQLKALKNFTRCYIFKISWHNLSTIFQLEHAFYLNISEDHLKTIIRCYELSFFRHILQAIYIFAYEKINQNKVLTGSTQYSKRQIFVLRSEFK